MARPILKTHACIVSKRLFGGWVITDTKSEKTMPFDGDGRRVFLQALAIHADKSERDEEWRIDYAHLILDRFAFAMFHPTAGANAGFQHRSAENIAELCVSLANYSALAAERDARMEAAARIKFWSNLPPLFSDDTFTLFDSPEFDRFALRVNTMAAQFPVSDKIGLHLLSILRAIRDLPENNRWLRMRARTMVCRRFCAALAQGNDEMLHFLMGDALDVALVHLSAAIQQPDHEF